MNWKRYTLFFCLILLFNQAIAQEQLALEQAIEIVLKNNYDIIITKNNATIAENNNSLGNAGMLPKIDVNASTNSANNTTKQEFANGLIVDRGDVKSTNINAGVFLTWTLFDGMKMFATHKRLQELEMMGNLATKIQIENTLSELIITYYNVVRQKQLIKALNENIVISEERLKIAEKKLEIGSGSKLDVLQAKVDKNAQTSNLLRQKTMLTDLKIVLNQLLARNVETELNVADDIPVQFQIKYDEIKNDIQKKNISLVYAQRSINMYNQQVKENKALLFPKLNFNTSYVFARSENQAGFALYNQNIGLNYGFTFNWTIFNGLNNSTQIKNARLQLENANVEYNNAKALIELQLFSTFKKYQDDTKLLFFEEENVDLVKEAVGIALERFKIGSSNSLELKEIQKSYDEALTRLADARYNAKVSETNLMKLSGAIIK